MLSVQIEMDTQNVLLCWTYKNITQFIAVRSSLNGTYNLPVKRRLTISISLAQSTNYACGIYINTHIRYMQVCISVSSNMLLTCSSGIAVAECQAQEDIRPTDVTTTHYITEGRSICRDKNHVQLEFLCLCKQLALCMHMCACLLFARTLD